jgi:hypothetical protein
MNLYPRSVSDTRALRLNDSIDYGCPVRMTGKRTPILERPSALDCNSTAWVLETSRQVLVADGTWPVWPLQTSPPPTPKSVRR